LLVVVEVGAVVAAAVGRAEEDLVAAECRPRQAVRLLWAEAWAPEPQRDPRLAPQAVRAG
jgi:hypothetical protein